MQLTFTAEVCIWFAHACTVAYWELSAPSPTSSPGRAMPLPLLTFFAVVMSLYAVPLECEVWVRPAQVGALFLHNLRVCLTFGHVMYPLNHSYTTWGCANYVMCPLNNSYTTWGCAKSFSMLCMYLQNNVALFLNNLRLCWLFFAFFWQYVGRRGWVQGDGHPKLFNHHFLNDCWPNKHLENAQWEHSGVAFICAMNCSVRISSFYRTQTLNPM